MAIFITNYDFDIVDSGGTLVWAVETSVIPPLVVMGTAGDDAFISLAAGADRSHQGGYVAAVGGVYADPDDAKIANLMMGGLGNDLYQVDHAGDTVVENAGEGSDTVATVLDGYSLGANVENLQIWVNFVHAANAGLGDDGDPGAALHRTATGNALNNIITAITDFDLLGGDNALARSQISFTLDGGAGNDSLVGGDGNDHLVGGTGVDAMAGGKGDDTYAVDAATDLIVEGLDAGYDTVLAAASYSLAANVEAGVLVEGTAAIALTGNALGNDLEGNSGNNTLIGGLGDDELRGLWGNDNLQGGEGADILVGNGLEAEPGFSLPGSFSDNDILDGGVGNDLLVALGLGSDSLLGGLGNDVLALAPLDPDIAAGAGLYPSASGNTANFTLNGGAGDDVYLLHVAALVSNNGYTNPMPRIVEAAGGGNDTVYLVEDLTRPVADLTEQQEESLEFLQDALDDVGFDAPGVVRLGTLAAEVENLVADGLHGTAIEVVGNGSANLLVGSNGEIGDYLAGGAGNDTLDGRMGADILIGGDGNDTYVVDDSGDSIIESATALASTADTVYSSVSYALSRNVENLTLAGIDAINGVGNESANLIIGNAAANGLFGNDGNDRLFGLGGNDRLYGQIGNDTLDGGAGNDTMYGGQDNDVYVVDSATDHVYEWSGQGSDTVSAAVSYNLVGKGYVETLVGTSTAGLTLTGNGATNTIIGNSGNDVLNDDGRTAGAGTNWVTMIGGAGNDTYILHNILDKLVEGAAAGTDTLDDRIAGAHSLNLTNALFANVENVTVTTTVGVNVTGTTGANAFVSGAGTDVFIGAGGNDSYFVQETDTVTEAAAGGSDTIYAQDFSLTLGAGNGANVENGYMRASTAAHTLTGDANANLLGDDVANTTFAATLAGAGGNDTYELRAANTVVTEGSGAGTDLVHTYLAATHMEQGEFTLAANVEQLTVHGIAAGTHFATGNALANILQGTTESGVSAAGVSFILDGGAASDTVGGGLGNDFLIGGSGADVLRGFEGNDELISGSYDFILESTSFDLSTVDTLFGGKGNDWYQVRNGDAVTEVAGEGFDTVSLNLALSVMASTTVAGVQTYSYALPANVEALQLASLLNHGSAGAATSRVVAVTGSANADRLTALGEIWDDGAGGLPDLNVRLDGGANADILEAFASTAFGGSGMATLVGGLGDDVFLLSGDAITTVEAVGGGTDTAVLLQGGGSLDVDLVTYTLDANVDNLLVGNDDHLIVFGSQGGAYLADTRFDLSGNALANLIVGGGDNDTLDGGASADTLVGGAGDDLYGVDNLLDRLVEDGAGGGIDSILVSISGYNMAVNAWNVENATYDNGGGNLDDALNVTLIGNNLDNTLTGGQNGGELLGVGGDDVLIGGAGDDTLRGGNGDDTLEGGTGEDHLYGGFGADTFILDDTSVDTVHSFDSTADVLVVRSASFTPGTVYFDDFGNFVEGAGDLATQQAAALGAGDTWFWHYDDTIQVADSYYHDGASWVLATHFDFDNKPGITEMPNVHVAAFEIIAAP